MTFLKIQNVKTRFKMSKCQNVILSKFLKSLDGYDLEPKCQSVTESRSDKMTFWPQSQRGYRFQPPHQNITQAHYYVMGASLRYAPIRVTRFPLLGKLCSSASPARPIGTAALFNSKPNHRKEKL